ncbi:MAG: TRL-like family protein [Nitrospirae bacterium]|nr:TRL-like family protein [Nitrospirota bacterium]
MKKIIKGVLAVIFLATMSGCVSAPVFGILFTAIDAPVTATSNVGATKEGRGSCMSVLGMVAVGDCSIATAAKEAGITKIMTVDHSFNSVLGFFAKYTVIVKGE